MHFMRKLVWNSKLNKTKWDSKISIPKIDDPSSHMYITSMIYQCESLLVLVLSFNNGKRYTNTALDIWVPCFLNVYIHMNTIAIT